MSYIVNGLNTIVDGCNDFFKSPTVGPHQLFVFPSKATYADNQTEYKQNSLALMNQFTTRPSLQYVIIDGAGISAEKSALIDAATKLIGPNFDQRTVNQNTYQLQNNKLFAIVINNYEPMQDAMNQSPMDLQAINEIFKGIKILIVYMHKPIEHSEQYIQSISNKVISSFDEDKSDLFSVISNQVKFFTTQATAGNPDPTYANIKSSGTQVFKVDGTTAYKVGNDDQYYTQATWTFIRTMVEARNCNVFFLDASSSMAFISDLHQLMSQGPSLAADAGDVFDPTKPFVLIIQGYQLQSSLQNRELLKLKSLLMSERQNASGAGYGVCQFVLATPTVNPVYLCYQTV